MTIYSILATNAKIFLDKRQYTMYYAPIKNEDM